MIPYGVPRYPAPAKLNRNLHIVGRRADGYHLLESIFCLIDLCDQIGILPREDGKIILHTPAPGVVPEQDLIYRAARALQQFCGNDSGADIWLEKNIPMGGGLGGGSSDAATVLLVLNRIWQCGLDSGRLAEIGLQLGADVPFFLFGRDAFVQGIGEILREIDVPQQWYVIVKPDVHVSTAKIFSHEGLTRDTPVSIMPSFRSLQPFKNDMQGIVFKEYPEVFEAFSSLSQYAQAIMTGSGACIFSAFNSRREAQAVFGEVSKIHQAYLVRGLKRHPLFDV